MTRDPDPAELSELGLAGDGWATVAESDAHEGHDGTGGDHGPSGSASVRALSVDGHEVRIETTYRITVDGQPFVGHLEVLDDGRVHYHGLPNYAVTSMVDLMRLVVEHFGTTPPAVDELGEDPAS